MRLTTSARIAIALALGTTVVVAQDVRYNFSSEADFSKYKTYKWVSIKGAEQLDQITDQQVKAAIDGELSKKGLLQVRGDDAAADLFIGYQPSLRTEQQVTTFDNGWGYGPGWGYGWYGGGGGGISTSTTSTIPIGQIDLDMYDPAKKQLVWRGVASKTLDTKAKPEKREKNLRKAAEKLLKNYPPPPKKIKG
jgi:hypothetical protein